MNLSHGRSLGQRSASRVRRRLGIVSAIDAPVTARSSFYCFRPSTKGGVRGEHGTIEVNVT